MEQIGKIPCKKCLLQELGDETLLERIKRTIEMIPMESRVSDEEYQMRLDACKACDRLLSGMCRVCGCFVEVRAMREKQHCPLPKESKW